MSRNVGIPPKECNNAICGHRQDSEQARIYFFEKKTSHTNSAAARISFIDHTNIHTGLDRLTLAQHSDHPLLLGLGPPERQQLR